MEVIIDIDHTWTKSLLHVCPLSEDPIIKKIYTPVFTPCSSRFMHQFTLPCLVLSYKSMQNVKLFIYDIL